MEQDTLVFMYYEDFVDYRSSFHILFSCADHSIA
ncbi:unnamed protein product [Camellia sinensis]